MTYFKIAIAIGLFLVGLWAGYSYEHREVAVISATYTQKIDEANANGQKILAAANAQIAKLQADQSTFDTKLEQQHVQDTQATNAIHTADIGRSLRFRTNNSACRTNPVPATANTSSNPSTSSEQLPDPIATSLRQLTYEADQLADDYRTLYNWAHGIDKVK